MLVRHGMQLEFKCKITKKSRITKEKNLKTLSLPLKTEVGDGNRTL
jgi:hypothetical protein